MIERPSAEWSETTEGCLSPPACLSTRSLSFGLTNIRPNPDAARTSEVHTAYLSTPECVESMASDTAAMQRGRASDSTQQCHPALEQPAESERAPSPFRTPTNPILSLAANARAAAREEGALSASVMLALLRACEECAICVFLPLACVHRTVQATPAAPLWGSLVCAAATAVFRLGGHLGACSCCIRRHACHLLAVLCRCFRIHSVWLCYESNSCAASRLISTGNAPLATPSMTPPRRKTRCQASVYRAVI